MRLISETSNRRIERGRTRTPVDRLPYPIDLAVAKLTRGAWCWPARAPVGFFAYPGKPSLLAPDCAQVVLATQEQDLAQALEWLADELGIAADAPRLTAPAPTYEVPASGKLTGAAVNILVAHTLPEQAIVCDESITQGREFPLYSVSSAPLAHADRRRHRHRPAAGHRRGGRLPGSQGGHAAGRRQRHVRCRRCGPRRARTWIA